MKKILIFISLFVLLFTSCSDNKAEIEEIVNVEVIQMNDIHGHIENEGKYGGLARANTLINNIRDEDSKDNTVLIANGDMLQETAISRVGYGKVVIDSMNEMGFDMMGIGNHEFDWGLEEVTKYFDGDKANGEANFPLVNSNIYYKNNLVTGNNICSSLLLEKENVKVGIVSYIGDVYNSINANMTIDYLFKAKPTDIADSVLELGRALKNKGANLIIVNIHDGDSDGSDRYEPNRLISELKYNNKYLVDAIINGHTHTKQDTLLKRTDGNSLPVIQSSGKLSDFGRIDIKYNTTKNEVEDVSLKHVNIASAANDDLKINNIIKKHKEENKAILEEVYCYNEAKINRYNNKFYAYAANIMMTACGTDAAVFNTGAFRNNVNKGDFGFEELYALSPFDNHIVICEIKGIDLKRFFDANSEKEVVYTRDYGFSIATDKTYTLAIVDYVYFGTYFSGYRTTYKDTNLILRDLIASDLRLRDNFNINDDYNNILISKIFNE